MVKEDFIQKVNFPEGISASIDNGIVSIKGPKGVVSKNFKHPKVKIIIDDEGITFEIKKFTQKEKKIVQTFIAHLKNLFKGVTEGHEYKLKICSGHFPMNVSIKGNVFEVKNFIGEAVPRTYELKNDVDVKLNGEIIQVTGINKELVSQTAASIEQLTRRVGFDTRIFQDGIYIIDKDGKSML
jgi:large subunit ribosomal protein L6